MKTGSKKSTITIITLACLLAVAVASTVILAAFSAVRTSTTTITFAEGLTMDLTPKGTATIQITDTPASFASTGSFSYTATESTQYEEPVTLDGIKAQLNKAGWVAYQITLQETITTPAQGGGDPTVTTSAIAGAWAQGTDANVNKITFTPTATNDDDSDEWTAVLTIDSSKVTVSVASNVVTVKFNAQWTGTPAPASPEELFASIVIDGTTAGNVNALAGRIIVAGFIIKADTSDGIGANNDQNPITFA